MVHTNVEKSHLHENVCTTDKHWLWSLSEDTSRCWHGKTTPGHEKPHPGKVHIDGDTVQWNWFTLIDCQPHSISTDEDSFFSNASLSPAIHEVSCYSNIDYQELALLSPKGRPYSRFIPAWRTYLSSRRMASKPDEEIVTSIICNTGDLLLVTKDESGTVRAQYRVSSKAIIDCSGYYRKLLASTFSEGVQFRQESKLLLANHGENLVKAPLSELPTISLPFPIGLTRIEVILTAFKLFLQCIHREKLTTVEKTEGDWILIRLSSDIDLFAHVVVISDQLDASIVIEQIAKDILKGKPMCTKKPRKGDQDSERYWRQLLYVAYLQKQTEAFKWISGSMILHGFDTVSERELEAPWMNLPNHIDGTINTHRIVDTEYTSWHP